MPLKSADGTIIIILLALNDKNFSLLKTQRLSIMYEISGVIRLCLRHLYYLISPFFKERSKYHAVA